MKEGKYLTLIYDKSTKSATKFALRDLPGVSDDQNEYLANAWQFTMLSAEPGSFKYQFRDWELGTLSKVGF